MEADNINMHVMPFHDDNNNNNVGISGGNLVFEQTQQSLPLTWTDRMTTSPSLIPESLKEDRCSFAPDDFLQNMSFGAEEVGGGQRIVALPNIINNNNNDDKSQSMKNICHRTNSLAPSLPAMVETFSYDEDADEGCDELTNPQTPFVSPPPSTSSSTTTLRQGCKGDERGTTPRTSKLCSPIESSKGIGSVLGDTSGDNSGVVDREGSRNTNGEATQLSSFDAVGEINNSRIQWAQLVMPHTRSGLIMPTIIAVQNEDAMAAVDAPNISSMTALHSLQETNDQGAVPLSIPMISTSNPRPPFEPDRLDLDDIQGNNVDCGCTIISQCFLSLMCITIVMCWVVLAGDYVVSMNMTCDVPLKLHFWLATLLFAWNLLRLVMFRLFQRWWTNMIRCRFMGRLFPDAVDHDDDNNNNNNNDPYFLVVAYNHCYVAYACFVVQLGIQGVFIQHGGTCHHTAPELFQSSTVFVCLSLATLLIDVVGVFLPLTLWNFLNRRHGYSPQTVFVLMGLGGIMETPPSAGVPPGCMERMSVVAWNDALDSSQHCCCCICLDEFDSTKVNVATPCCDRVFHKHCLQSWLDQYRSCPVCRADIPSSLNASRQMKH